MRKSFTNVQVIFLASIISLDFASGMLIKNVLLPTNVLTVIRLDMIVPVALMMLSRLIIDRFGTLIVYEAMWGALSVAAMPGAFGLPGLLKLAPSLMQGIAYDSFFSSLRRIGALRVYIAAVTGGFISSMVQAALKIMLGIPCSTAAGVLFGTQAFTSVLVNILGSLIALIVWARVRNLHLIKRIQAGA